MVGADHFPLEGRLPGMLNREERVVQNEVSVRNLNERIVGGRRGWGTGSEPMICECGIARCVRSIGITREEYERIRSDPLTFAVVKEHIIPDVEVPAWETDRFVVVRKHEGKAADMARELDPRRDG
jgi:hypothetical protein